MSDLVSIIVPVYNVAPYVTECLDSILGQTYPHIEVLVVDDGSTDDSGAVCDMVAARDERVRVIHQANAGLSAARNAGLEIARGDYIAFVDSDDAVSPRFLEALLSTRADIAQCVFCTDVRSLCAGPVAYGCKDRLDRRMYAERASQDASGAYTVVWNKLYRASLLREVRFPVGRQHEDEYVTYRLAWSAQDIAVLPYPLYFYRQRLGSTMATGFTPRSLDAFSALEGRAAFYREQGEKRLALLAEATLCHRLRACAQDCRRSLPAEWPSLRHKMIKLWRKVAFSPQLSVKKRLSITLQMISPRLHARLAR